MKQLLMTVSDLFFFSASSEYAEMYDCFSRTGKTQL